MNSQEYMEQLISEIPPDEMRFTRYSMDIIERIHDILDEKGLTQKDFAELMGKKESEISKWLQIDHNLTIKTLAKIEIALDAPILFTPKRAEKNKLAESEEKSNKNDFVKV